MSGNSRGKGRQAEQAASGSRDAPPPSPQSAWGGQRGGGDDPQPGPSDAASSSGSSSKRTRDNEPTGQQAKYRADSASRGESVRGAIHGAKGSRNRGVEDIVETRPAQLNSKKGEGGQPVSLIANYFRVNRAPKWNLYTYHVEFRPELEIRGVKQRLMREQQELFNGYLFDGTRLFTTTRLEMPNGSLEISSRTREDQEVLMVLRDTGELSMRDAGSLQVLNLIIRRAMQGLNLQLVGRNYYDAAASIDIPQHHIQLWPGYTTSIRQHETDILMCAEIGTKLMRTETILDILGRLHGGGNRDWQNQFIATVVGSTVLTRYNNKTYRIDDVDFTCNPTNTFETKDGPKQYLDYYREKYNIVIRDERQPLLISRASARDIRGGRNELIILIPELCSATGFTDDMRKNFKLMADVSQHTRVGPPGRIQRLLQFNQRLNSTPASTGVFTEWNLQLDNNLVEIKGRVLANENIVFGNNTVPTDGKADWTNAIRNAQAYGLIPLKRWYVITTQRNSADTKKFVQGIQAVSRNLGFEVNQPRIKEISDDRVNTYTQALEECCNDNPQMIFCTVSNDQADRYAAIKKKCCVDRAVPTQVVKSFTMRKAGLSVPTKVAMQMLCKLGGTPWTISMPLSKVMVIGYDVCHDTKDKSKSFGAMVATMDQKQRSQYFSATTPHTNGEELSNELALNIVKALHEFNRVEGELPDRILIYRDGVGEGQTQYVYEHEVTNIQAKLKAVYGEIKPIRLCFIIVSKRINTRIFTSKRSNPPPGTVVDDVITLPERYDFYLISQHVGQGSASPTSYNVFDYGFGLAPGRLQQLTYKMCHLYYNWTGTTRVPSVCQYAHKLAFLMGQYVHTTPSAGLEKLLYFL